MTNTKVSTLEILDEVNIRFHGLDPHTRRKLVQSLEYMIPGMQFSMAYKLGRFNGKKSLADIGGRSYVNMLSTLIPIVQDAGYSIVVDDKRPKLAFDFKTIDENTFSHIMWPSGHPLAGKPIVFRDHQVKAINAYLDTNNGVKLLPTGSGKTLITSGLALAVESYGKTLTIVPSRDLGTQTSVDFINVGLNPGLLMGEKDEVKFAQMNHHHVIATYQTLESVRKRYPDELAGFLIDVKAVIVDECFAPHTNILTPSGYKEIKDLSPGDKVINFSEKTKEFKEDEIVKIHVNLPKSDDVSMYSLRFDNGEIIEVTGNHEFLTSNRGWVRADELHYKDDIVDNKE